MLLDLWSFAIIVSDLIDFILYYVENGTFYVTFPFLIFTSVFLLICAIAWRSTNIPDTPPPPRPPYVIQIQGSGNGRSQNRQTLSDVRLISSGPHVESAFRRFPHQQIPISELNIRSRSEGYVGALGRTNREPSSLFFGLLRRPTITPILPIRPIARARFTAPNLIVYHRVNVYHHTTPSNRNINQNQTRNSNSNLQHDNVRGLASHTSAANTDPQVQPLASTSGSFIHSTPTTTTNGEIIVAESETSSIRVSVAQSQQNITNSSQSPSTPDYRNTGRQDIDFSVENNLGQVQVDIPTTFRDDDNDLGPQLAVEVHTEEEIAVVETEEESDEIDIGAERDLTIDDSVLYPGMHQQDQEDSNQLRHRTTESHPASYNNSNPPEQVPERDDNSRKEMSRSKETPTGVNHPANGDESEDVRFIIKFLNDTQMEVTSQYSETIGDFKRRHFATEISENKVVRLIFNGRVLDGDSRTLRESGIFDHCVVHCLIVTRQSPTEGPVGSSQTAGRGSGGRVRGPEPGMFFVSIMGIILIFLWFICFHFGQQLFTQSAIVSLTVLTAIFLIGLVAFYLPIHPNN